MIHGFFNYSGMLEGSRTAVAEAGSILRGAIGHAKGLATVDRKVTDKIINNDTS